MKAQKLYLKSCLSTNDFIKQGNLQEESIAVYTFHQTKGKGQRGNSWLSEPMKNLAISFGIPKKILPKNRVLVSMLTANFTRNFIQQLIPEKVFIKWPNDIMVKDKKISGILIEENPSQFILGIGININQLKFNELPNAISLAVITGKEYELEDLTNRFIDEFQSIFPIEVNEIQAVYNHYLYRKGEELTFKAAMKDFSGKIRSVDEKGKLNVWNSATNELEKFAHGEIQMNDY